MKKRFLSFSLVALLALTNVAPSAEPAQPASKPSPAWDKIPGAAHHPRIREARLRYRLADASREEVELALRNVAANEVSSESSADYLVVTEILARKTGAASLALAQKYRTKELTARSVRDAFVRGLAKAEVDAAAAWLDAAPGTEWDDDEKTELARIILQTHTRLDAAGAMQRALRYAGAEPSRAETFVSAVIEELVYHGRFETARTLTRELAAPGMRRTSQAELIGIVAEQRPELASAWFHELPPDQERPGMIFRLAEAWASRSLREAVAFYETLAPEERTIDLVEVILVNSSDPQPEVVEKLAAGFSPGPELDRLLVAALNRIDTLLPSEIPWRWFERFTHTRGRDALLLNLLAPRFQRDPATVKSIVEQLAFLAPEQRDALRAALARGATAPHGAPARAP